MFSLEDLLNNSSSPTSGPCQWTRRCGPDTSACQVKDLLISRHADKEPEKINGLDNYTIGYTFSEHIDYDPRLPSQQNTMDIDKLKQITKKIMTLPTAVSALFENMYPSPCQIPAVGKEAQFLPQSPVNTVTLVPIMEKKLIVFMKYNMIGDAKDFLEDLSFSSDEIDEIDKTTRRQCQCQEWFDSKIGFITASKAKNVYTRQQSYEANSTEDISRIVETIVKHTSHQSIRNNTDGEPTNPMKWGLRHEENARDGYLRTEGRKHNKIQLSTKGFVISKQKPFLGASPDNIRSCKCKRSCQNVLVEYKCPFSHKEKDPKEAFLSREVGGMKNNGEFLLKPSTRYFYQVQLQMFVCELSACDFEVWTTKGIFITQVTFDPKFMESICVTLETFWVTHVIPRMMKNVQAEINSVELLGNFLN